MAGTMTLGEMAKALNRSVVYLSGVQKRFDLPVLEGAGYSPAYFAFLRKIVHLRLLSVPEDRLIDLWKTEKHLLQLLHFDPPGSPTWFLDACNKTDHAPRRLLLTHYDMGPEFANRLLQPHLDFDPASSGLFSHKEVGDNILRVLDTYHELQTGLQRLATAEAPVLRATLHFLPRLRAFSPAE